MVDRNRRQRGLNLPVEHDLSAHHIVFRDCDGRDKGHKDASHDPNRIIAMIEHAGFPFFPLIMGPFSPPGNILRRKNTRKLELHRTVREPFIASYPTLYANAGITEFNQ